VRRIYNNAMERWVAAGYPNYSPWVPIAFHSFTLGAVIGAIVQRIPDGNGPVAAGLLAFVVLPYAVSEIGSPRVMPWPLFTVLCLGGVGVLMWRYPIDLDFAVLVTALIVGRAGALETMKNSAVVCTTAIAGLVAIGATNDFDSTAFSASVVLAGWDLGWIMQYQQRRIDQQQREQVQREVRAALEERQRIARELHDVVAHSLSVTMLHLTAARRDLQDGGDVGEAIAALNDAEQIGREAMNDIRQTVGLLGKDSDQGKPAPDLADVPALVEQFRSAGLDVGYETAGDGSLLSAAARTGLFRIVQESLANIAKHQPHARASVSLDLSLDPGRLVIRNSLTHPVSEDGGGSGLRGMQERAALLGGSFFAGPDRDGWQVLVELPNPHVAHCPLPKLSDLRRGAAPETA